MNHEIKSYIAYLEQAKAKCSENAIIVERIERIISELKFPQILNLPWKYKIPHKYLLDVIGKPDLTDSSNAVKIFGDRTYKALKYFELDKKLPKTFGEEIEARFEDPKSFLLLHFVSFANPMNNTEYSNSLTKQKIFKSGVRQATQDEDCITNCARTTIGNYQDKLNFFDFLDYKEAVILRIPRQAFDKHNPLPIWGANTPTVDMNNPGYIIPRYVDGYIHKDNKIERNSIAPAERLNYAYKFIEKSTQSVREKVTEK